MAIDIPTPLWQFRFMFGEPRNRFTLTRLALRRATHKGNLLPVLLAIALVFGVGGASICLGQAEKVADDELVKAADYTSPFVNSVRPGNVGASDTVPERVDIALNDYIWVDVVKLDEWLASLSTNTAQKRSTLMPCFNGVALSGIYPENPDAAPDTNWFHSDLPIRVYHLRFHLTRKDDATVRAWKSLLDRPVRTKPLTVTIATQTGDQLSTTVTPGKPDPKIRLSEVNLVVIPLTKGIISLLIIAAALCTFVLLARTTDILRDTTSPKRADGLPSFSLARTQMAFWFFLALTAFALLWLITGDTNTVTVSVLGLIGISAGTALSSTIIDSAKTSSDDVSKSVIPDELREKTEAEMLAALKTQRSDVRAKLISLQAERARLDVQVPGPIESNQQQQNALRANLATLNTQINFLSMKPWKRVMYDLLGDNGSISFHRFQIFVWTIILGLIFVADVYEDLAMPDFNGTLLALMGISAGTFIGFKIPEQKPSSS